MLELINIRNRLKRAGDSAGHKEGRNWEIPSDTWPEAKLTTATQRFLENLFFFFLPSSSLRTDIYVHYTLYTIPHSLAHGQTLQSQRGSNIPRLSPSKQVSSDYIFLISARWALYGQLVVKTMIAIGHMKAIFLFLSGLIMKKHRGLEWVETTWPEYKSKRPESHRTVAFFSFSFFFFTAIIL